MRRPGFKKKTLDEVRLLRRRRTINKIGKKGKLNKRANAQMARDFKGAHCCEARSPHDCTGSEQLTWAHAKKRRKLPDEELTHAALVCVNYHNIIEVLPPEEMERIVDEIVAARDTDLPEAA